MNVIVGAIILSIPIWCIYYDILIIRKCFELHKDEKYNDTDDINE